MKLNVIALAVALASGSAYAHSEGDTIIKGGFSYFDTVTELDRDYQVSESEGKKNNGVGYALSLTHMASDKIGIELGYASGMTSTYRGGYNLGGGAKEFANYRIKGAPITLTVNYYFGDANSKFRPYVGAGIAYVNFKSPSVTKDYSQVATPAVAAVSQRWLDCSPYGGCVEVPDRPADYVPFPNVPTDEEMGVMPEIPPVSNETWPDPDMDSQMGVYPEIPPMSNETWPDPDMDSQMEVMPEYYPGEMPEYEEITVQSATTIEDVKVNPGFGIAAKAGFDYYFTDNFMLTASVTYMQVNSRLEWTERHTSKQSDGYVSEYTSRNSASLKTDPVYAMVGIGYRF